MAIQLEQVRSATRDEWARAVEATDHATYFQSPAWGDLWARHSQGRVRPAPLHVRFSDGVTGLVPLSAERPRTRLRRRALLSPAGTYGGLLADRPVGSEHLALVLDHLRRRYAGVTWRVSPFDPACGWMEAFPGADQDVTHAVDLRADSATRAREWSKGHRAAAKRAEREGVVVRTAEGAGDWAAYYGLYQRKLASWGSRATSAYPASFFELLAAQPRVTLWLATHDGEPVAGAVCLYGRRHIAYWHGASNEERAYLQPAHLLLRVAMDDAAAAGYWWFDFHPSGENPGVVSFKRGFGAAALPAPVLRVQGRMAPLLARLGRRA